MTLIAPGTYCVLTLSPQVWRENSAWFEVHKQIMEMGIIVPFVIELAFVTISRVPPSVAARLPRETPKLNIQLSSDTFSFS